jgi:hypothetical protein
MTSILAIIMIYANRKTREAVGREIPWLPFYVRVNGYFNLNVECFQDYR